MMASRLSDLASWIKAHVLITCRCRDMLRGPCKSNRGQKMLLVCTKQRGRHSMTLNGSWLLFAAGFLFPRTVRKKAALSNVTHYGICILMLLRGNGGRKQVLVACHWSRFFLHQAKGLLLPLTCVTSKPDLYKSPRTTSPVYSREEDT